MDSTRTKATPDVVETHPTAKYPYMLNFYDRPPLMDITLEQFETWAIDRLRVLAEIEASFVRNRSFDDLKIVIQSQCTKYLSLSSNTAHLRDLQGERLKDHVSHYILRLAFCRTDELKRRFAKAETTLFRIRYDMENEAQKRLFLASRGSEHAEEVSANEKQTYRTQLIAATYGITAATFEVEKFVKVPWTKVTALVEKRRVFIRGGMAYVPAREQPSMVFQDFQNRLEKALEITEKSLPRLDEDDRLVPILDHLSRGFLAGVTSEYTVGDEVAGGDAVTADMVDDLNKKHWPLCMRHLHETLRRDRHLKHYARLQYGLFLKAVGMSVEEALIFWKKSFSSITEDKFNKEYKYNIRHTYGLEGKRANYPAKSCQRIITNDQPSSQDSHGCPFRHFNADNLQLALQTHYRISAPSDLQEIMTAVRGEKYHVACTRVFELTHGSYGVKKGDGVGEGESVAHPNKYAARSRELETERNEREGLGIKKGEDGMDIDG